MVCPLCHVTGAISQRLGIVIPTVRTMFLKFARQIDTTAAAPAATHLYNSHGYIGTRWIREGRVMEARKGSERRVIKVTESEAAWNHELRMLEVRVRVCVRAPSVCGPP